MTVHPSQPVHGTAVALWTVEGWRGLWITGRSGAGKSDLALRLIHQGWRLVADDYAHVFASGGTVHAIAPDQIAGQMEMRGVGIVPTARLRLVQLKLIARLLSGPHDRLPERATAMLVGVALPVLDLDGFEASVPEKLARVLTAL